MRVLDACGRFAATNEITYVYRENPQKVIWNHRKAHDLIEGVLDLGEFSCAKNMHRLYENAVYRLCHDFAPIMRAVVFTNCDVELLEELVVARHRLRDCGLALGVTSEMLEKALDINTEAVLAVGELKACRQELAMRDAEVETHRSSLSSCRMELDERQSRLDWQVAENQRLTDELERQVRATQRLEKQVHDIHSSKSWRLSRGLSWIPRKTKKFVKSHSFSRKSNGRE